MIYFLILLFCFSLNDCYKINSIEVNNITYKYNLSASIENTVYNNSINKIITFLEFNDSVTCKIIYSNINLNNYVVILNCTIQEVSINRKEQLQITWTIPLVWLFFIPILILCFSYIFKCKCKKTLEGNQPANIIYRNGILP